jgi:hypothetical protein
LWRASGWLARPVRLLRSAAVAGTAAEAAVDLMAAGVAAFMVEAVAEDFTVAVEADSTATDRSVRRAEADHLAADAAADSAAHAEDHLAGREAGHLEDPADRIEEWAEDRLARGAEAEAWVRLRTRADLAAARRAGDLATARGDRRDLAPR